jgi:hypothetical protein
MVAVATFLVWVQYKRARPAGHTCVRASTYGSSGSVSGVTQESGHDGVWAPSRPYWCAHASTVITYSARSREVTRAVISRRSRMWLVDRTGAGSGVGRVWVRGPPERVEGHLRLLPREMCGAVCGEQRSRAHTAGERASVRGRMCGARANGTFEGSRAYSLCSCSRFSCTRKSHRACCSHLTRKSSRPAESQTH